MMTIWQFLRKVHLRLAQPGPDHLLNMNCSFCGTNQKYVGAMVEGPNHVYICVNCVRIAHQIAEGNKDIPVQADINDPSIRWAGHMHILCYFQLKRESEEHWKAIGNYPQEIVGCGSSPKDAIRDLHVKVLSNASILLSEAREAGSYLTRHIDARFR
jgi:hypothetical protein